jgi:hypothetical protein
MGTFEKQYNWQVALRDELGGYKLGLTSGSTYYEDPRRLTFLLSRYKFASKIITGKASVIEIGCGDAFGARLLMQEVPSYVGIDIDPIFVSDARDRPWRPYNPVFFTHDILAGPVNYPHLASSAVSLDVLEHINEERENDYFRNVSSSIQPDGVFVCGMPSLESQKFASGGGEGHVNCKTGDEFKRVCEGHFSNVFLFSMNDEVVHTGFNKMAHYLICVCVSPKR